MDSPAVVAELLPAARRRFGLKPGSIRLRLTAVFTLFLVLVVSLGAFSIQRLAEVNRDSEEIRSHWLEDTRLLGDLSNYMSDYRAGEATQLLAATPADIAASDAEVEALDARVDESGRAFAALSQEPGEAGLFANFAAQWVSYKASARLVLALSRAGRKEAAVELYRTTSRHAFDLASDTLSLLTDRTVAQAREATERAAVEYQHSRNLIVLAMVGALGLLIGGIGFVTHSISRPLRDLSARMAELARHPTPVPVPGTERAGEIGDMARAVEVFRDNSIALLATQRRLLEQAAALEAALDGERRLVEQERNFVAMTSHEFRTPLTVIDGQAQRLIKLRDRLDPADVALRGARIRSAVLRMTSIMDSLLEGARLIEGRQVFQRAPVDLVALLRETCQMHREMTEGAVIEEHYESLDGPIEGDAKLLFHALSNLLSNALKYSAPGQAVSVAARPRDGGVAVTVADHGIGIPSRDQKHVFDRYFRGGNATGIAGTGIGLHLVEMVAQLHGGSVSLESEEGVGSTFTLFLPRG